MEAKVGWVDISVGSIAEFASRNNLDTTILDSARDLLILPNNATFNELPNEHLFASNAKEVLYVLRESNINASMYQDTRDRRQLILKCDLVILPTLYFVAGAASSVALGVLSNWIYDKYVKNSKGDEQPSIRYESAERAADGSVRWRRVEGPANQVCRLLRQESRSLREGTNQQLDVATKSQNEGTPQWRTDQKKVLQKVSRKRKR
jgi:hypothetical protein